MNGTAKMYGIMALTVFAMSAGNLMANCGQCGHDDSAKDGCKDKGACMEKASCADMKKAGKDCGPCEGEKACGTAKKEAVGVVNTAGLQALLKSGTPLTVLDARSGKWDDGKRIPGAKSLNAASTKEDIAKTLPDKKALVVTYCSNLKCPASHALADKLTGMGYANVVEYTEGIAGWAEAGHEVENVK